MNPPKTEALIERLIDMGAKQADEHARSCIASYIELCGLAADALTARETLAGVPDGMKPWHGGDSAPEDWDGGPVITSRPEAFPLDDWRWSHVIAYTPKQPSPELPPVVGEERAIQAAYDAIYGQEMRQDGFEHPEGWDFATSVAAAVIASLSVDHGEDQARRVLARHGIIGSKYLPAILDAMLAYATEVRATSECLCAEIAGENPTCSLHGTGTVWAKENPDICEMADRLAEVRSTALAEGRAEGIEAAAKLAETQHSEGVECFRPWNNLVGAKIAAAIRVLANPNQEKADV